MLYVHVNENNEVDQCIDKTPGEGGDWREAIEVRDTLLPYRQLYDAHYFDLTKTPVEIVWKAIPRPVQDRKEQIYGRLNEKYQSAYSTLLRISVETDKPVDPVALSFERTERDANIALVRDAVDHDALDALALDV